MNRSKTVFISYSHKDPQFVSKLSSYLELRGASMWIDSKNITVGYSISKAVEDALSLSDFFCLVLSLESVQRPWVQPEYRAALTMQLSSQGNRPRILPIGIGKAETPPLLRDIRHADFEGGYQRGLELLCKAIGLEILPAPFIGIIGLLGSDMNEALALLEKAQGNSNTSGFPFHGIADEIISGAERVRTELQGILLDPERGGAQKGGEGRSERYGVVSVENKPW